MQFHMLKESFDAKANDQETDEDSERLTTNQQTEIFVWGSNNKGQLGIDQYNITIPHSYSFSTVIRQISCGENHSAMITLQGHLYTMGSNSKGQLGIGSQMQSGTPILVEQVTNVLQVSCGMDTTHCIVKQTIEQQTSVWAWGSNKYGQLGLPKVKSVNVPTRLQILDSLGSRVIQVSSGDKHTLYLTEQGEVIATGLNKQGQCGFHPLECQMTDQPFKVTSLKCFVIQIAAGQRHSLFLSNNGECFRTSSSCLPYQLDIKNVTQVSAGTNDAFIADGGALYLLQYGSFQFTKVSTIARRVVSVSLGRLIGCAIDDIGTIWTWGAYTSGVLGICDENPRELPYSIQTLRNVKITQVSTGGSSVMCIGQSKPHKLSSKSQKHQSQSMCREYPSEIGLQQIHNSARPQSSCSMTVRSSKSALKKQFKSPTSNSSLHKQSYRQVQNYLFGDQSLQQQNDSLKQVIAKLQNQLVILQSSPEQKQFQIMAMQLHNKLSAVTDRKTYYKRANQKLTKENEQLVLQAQQHRQNTQELEGKLHSNQQYINNLHSDREQMTTRIKQLENDLVTFNDSEITLQLQKSVSSLQSQLTDLKIEFKQGLQIRSELKVQLQTADEQIKQLQARCQMLEQENNELQSQLYDTKYQKDRQQYDQFISNFGKQQQRQSPVMELSVQRVSSLLQKKYKSKIRDHSRDSQSSAVTYQRPPFEFKSPDQLNVSVRSGSQHQNTSMQFSVNDLRSKYNEKLLKNLEQRLHIN